MGKVFYLLYSAYCLHVVEWSSKSFLRFFTFFMYADKIKKNKTLKKNKKNTYHCYPSCMPSGLGVHPKAAHFNAFYLLALIYQKNKRPWCWFKCRHYQRREFIWFMKEKKTTSELKIWCKKQKKDSMKPFDEVKNDSVDSETGGREGNHFYKQRFYTIHTVSFILDVKLEMY